MKAINIALRILEMQQYIDISPYVTRSDKTSLIAIKVFELILSLSGLITLFLNTIF